MSPPAACLAIVERGRAGVYETLKEQFEGRQVTGAVVRVRWDRRQEERRGHERPVWDDRRRVDRRRPPPETWRTLGFVLVREPEPHP